MYICRSKTQNIRTMQKKINLLATLLVIAIVLGGLSTCSDASFQEGFRRGTDEGMAKYETGYASEEDEEKQGKGESYHGS